MDQDVISEVTEAAAAAAAAAAAVEGTLATGLVVVWTGSGGRGNGEGRGKWCFASAGAVTGREGSEGSKGSEGRGVREGGRERKCMGGGGGVISTPTGPIVNTFAQYTLCYSHDANQCKDIRCSKSYSLTEGHLLGDWRNMGGGGSSLRSRARLEWVGKGAVCGGCEVRQTGIGSNA
jgi:hypothetical protein